MEFKFLQQLSQPAPVATTVSHDHVRAVQEALGDPTADRAMHLLETPLTIDDSHYTEWLALIRDIADEQGIKLTNKSMFAGIAFDVLDNDPLLSSLGGDNEDVKNGIINILWKQQSAALAKDRHERQMQQTAARHAREEEELHQLVGTTDAPSAASITLAVPAVAQPAQTPIGDASSILRQVAASPTGLLQSTLKEIESEGRASWQTVQLPQNPHPAGSQAYKSWIRGFISGAKDTLGIHDKPSTPKKSKRK